MRHPIAQTHFRQKGVTITEMMVALTISMVLLGGVLEIYGGTKQTYRVQKALSRLQGNGRFALEFLSRDLRMAGYQGCPNLDSVEPTPPNGKDVTIGQNTVTILVNSTNVAQGYTCTDNDNGCTVSPTYNGPASEPSNIAPGTDLLALTFGGCEAELSADMSADSTTATLEANNCAFDDGDLLIISGCGRSELFQAATGTDPDHTGTNSSPEPIVKTGGPSGFMAGDKVMRFVIRDYFIGSKTLASGATIPGLYQRDLAGNGAQELIEGVEDLQVLYGEEDPVNGTVTYVPASGVSDQSQVISVRINLLLQTVDDNLALNPQTYTFAGNTVTPTDRRLRRTFSTTVNLRNRSL